MTLDNRLLEKARDEAARLNDAERQAQLVRNAYHTAIRQLHLGGGSLREIADALQLSHQRVQQIVNEAGGSWWQRVWRSRNARQNLSCTFCERPNADVDKLIAGPNVYICDACVELAEKALKSGSNSKFMRSTNASVRCSFCRKRRNEDRQILASSAANICADCVRVCEQIVAAHQN